MDTCTSLIMRETIVFLPFDGILMRNTSFRAKRASELRAMYEGAVCSLDAIERFGRAPVTFRQVSSFPPHPTFSPTDRPTRSGFSPAVLGSAGDRQRNKSWGRPGRVSWFAAGAAPSSSSSAQLGEKRPTAPMASGGAERSWTMLAEMLARRATVTTR